MVRVYNCLVQEHDLLLVLLALIICVAGATVGAGVLRRAATVQGLARGGWLLLGGMTTGSTIWCTHFVAILAYAPSSWLGVGPLLTLGSLLVAILISSLGFTLAVALPAPLIGGTAVGLGASTMHYLGMAALGRDGIMDYNLVLVAASVLLAMLLSAAAVWYTLRRPGWGGWFGGTALLGLSVVSLHFTGMGAVRVLPLPVEGSSGQTVLALAVGVVALMVMTATAAAWLIERRSEEEGMNRLRRLADSSVEGLAVLHEGRIVDANSSLLEMTGLSRLQLLGQPARGTLLPRELPKGGEAGLQEIWLPRAAGKPLEVELVVRDNVPRPGYRMLAFRDLRERREHERRLQHVVLHDALTGLPNRISFTQHMGQKLPEALASGQRFALLRFGLNRLKEVNDLHGHAAGDAVLRAYAQCLGRLRGDLWPARLGGDEFALLLPYDEPREVEALAAAAEGLAIPQQGSRPAVTAAIGVALFPADATDAEALLANADLAMRRAKERRSPHACFYQAEMDAAVLDRRRMADDLRAAAGKGELSLFYQPQLAVGSSHLCGHEALMRWHHPLRGNVSPAVFIHVAEESGLIVALGEWALRTACAQAAAAPHLGKVAVNLSPAQFQQDGLPELVATALAEAGLPPQRLELEITESSLMQDPGRTLEVLRAIKALGVSVAMDDFGTGHSSLATLRAFPFDKIKLDRSFMPEVDSDPQARAILRAVLGIGRGLGVPVLAEGVETDAQLHILQEEGCAEAQGYLLGRPQPLRALAASPAAA